MPCGFESHLSHHDSTADFAAVLFLMTQPKVVNNMGFLSKAKMIKRRIKGASFQRMNQNIQAIHRETNKNRLFIFLDMVWCAAKYGVGYLDYHVFGFSVNRGKKRRTFMTMQHNVGLTRMVNDATLYPIMNDKLQFLETYHNFIGRKWIDVRQEGVDGLKQLCQMCGTIFVKPISDFGGTGIERISINESTDYQALYKRLIERKQYLAEEAVKQHTVMDTLCSGSVNTLRIVTLTVDSQPHFLYALLRVGSGNNHVDNISSGGMYTIVGENGMLNFPAFCDKTGLYYDVHPVSGASFVGFTIPFFQQAIALCLEAAKAKLGLAYIGWDVAITDIGPVLIEGNILPGYDMVQNSKFHPDGIGLLPTVEKILGKPVPKA